jgi:hypothetical protein
MNEQNKAYAFVQALGNALYVTWWIAELTLVLFMAHYYSSGGYLF